MSVTSIVLAGGRSLRLGRDKVQEKLGVESLLQRVLRLLNSLGGDILVVTSQERTEPLPLAPDVPVKVLRDIYPGRGALGGLYSGLVASNTQYNLVVGCDTPFLNLDFLRYLINVAEGFDVAVPRLGEYLEPLHAVYSHSCLAVIEPLVKLGQYPIFDIYPDVAVRYVEADEIDRFDPEHLSFLNINTEADLERARLIYERGH
ncbi:MAG: molybdenum cofactor guanylyltransferase [Chloroflexi bacterium]|nr:molybdenum cofactor guanylyltransferase [Chloroflexota bacterium]